MPEKVTPERIHQAFVQTQQGASEEEKTYYAHVAHHWDALTPEQQQIFATMALKFNAIVGEFHVEEEQS
jgi:hypothetical protein